MEIWFRRFLGSNAKMLELVLEFTGHGTPNWLQEFSGLLLDLGLLQWLQLVQTWWRVKPCGVPGHVCLGWSSLSFARAALGDLEDRPPGAAHPASGVRPELVLPYPVLALSLPACDIAPAPRGSSGGCHSSGWARPQGAAARQWRGQWPYHRTRTGLSDRQCCSASHLQVPAEVAKRALPGAKGEYESVEGEDLDS